MTLNVRRTKRGVYFCLGSALLVLLIAWCGLYLYARSYQRRAQRLVAEIQGLHPGTSSFADAMRVAHQYAQFVNYSPASCTASRCGFEIRLSNWFEERVFFYAIPNWDSPWKAWIAGAARSAGLRPVTTSCYVAIRDGVVVRSGAGYIYRTSRGSLAGAGVTAVKEFTLADRCRVRSRKWADVEQMYVSMITPGGGQEFMLAYPTTANPDIIKRASEINFSCMTRIPDCDGTPYSMLPLEQTIRADVSSPEDDVSDSTVLQQCDGLTPEEQNNYAFGSVE